MDNSNGELKQISDSLDSQVLGSTSSLSLPSEPPDIRNWFPSYEYESPVLDSNENFGDSVSKEIQFAKTDLVIEGEKEENPGGLKKIRKRDEEFFADKLCSNGFVNCSSFLGSDKLEGPSFNKLEYSSDSPLLLSEPPDIRNWFASYVYESPELDTSNYFGDSLSKDGECECDGFVNEESNTETGKTQSNSFGNNEQRQQSSREGDNGVGGNENLSAQENSCFGKPFKQTLKDSSALILQGSQCQLQKPQKTTCMPENMSKTLGCDDGKSLEKSLEQFICKRDSTHGSSGKENEGKDSSENGFFTTRKKNKENFLRSPEGISRRAVPLGGGKNGATERKSLAETTNFQYSDAKEVAGKWRCPQKSKPNLGPPLKQLRLEQWIHRK